MERVRVLIPSYLNIRETRCGQAVLPSKEERASARVFFRNVHREYRRLPQHPSISPSTALPKWQYQALSGIL